MLSVPATPPASPASAASFAAGSRDLPAAPRLPAGLRVLIAHDWVVTWAGSERCVLEMLELFPDADLYVGLMDPRMRAHNATTRRARETWLGRLPFAHRHHRWFVGLEPFAFASLDTSKYDLVLSSSHALAKAVRRPRGGVHVSYCHSPPRYLYDLSDRYREDARGLERLAFLAGSWPLRRIDQLSARGVTQFVANSHFVRERIGRVYGRDARVVYPPVAPRGGADVHRRTRGDFLLHLGRLVPYKRIDLAVRAVEELGIPLVIAGDGPDRTRLEAMAGPHTRFLGAVDEATAAELLSTCAAFVFAAEEDFGIAPVEANAHGAPVVGYARGGLTETMVDGVTAVLFPEQRVASMRDAIVRALGRRWDVEALRANAMRFAPEVYRRGLSEVVATTLASRASSGARAGE